MNLRARRELSRKYIRLTDQWTAKYEKAIATTIRLQIQGAIGALRQGAVNGSPVNGINAAKRYLNATYFDSVLTKVLTKLFREFAIELATLNYKRLIRASRRKLKAEGGAFGHSEEWDQSITDYLNNYLLTRAVIPVTENTKKQILRILLQGQAEGWGVDRIIQELENEETEELTRFRARRIVRTELSIAANFADKMVQDKVPFEVEKIWISVHDNRTRDSHVKMDGITVDGDADFHVPIIKKRVQIGIDLMSGPGDPEATPGNVINCRCTRALIPKRDKNNRLIPKPKKIAA
jgi:uncharacterized protein with gpF-like domain